MTSPSEILAGRLAEIFGCHSEAKDGPSDAARDLVACLMLHWAQAEPDMELPEAALQLIGELVARADPTGARDPLEAINAYFEDHGLDSALWAEVQQVMHELLHQPAAIELDDAAARLLALGTQLIPSGGEPPPAGAIKSGPFARFDLGRQRLKLDPSDADS